MASSECHLWNTWMLHGEIFQADRRRTILKWKNRWIWSLRSRSVHIWIDKLIGTCTHTRTTRTLYTHKSGTHTYARVNTHTDTSEWCSMEKHAKFFKFSNQHISFYMCKCGEMNRNVEKRIRCVFDVRQSVIGIMLVW